MRHAAIASGRTDYTGIYYRGGSGSVGYTHPEDWRASKLRSLKTRNESVSGKQLRGLKQILIANQNIKLLWKNVQAILRKNPLFFNLVLFTSGICYKWKGLIQVHIQNQWIYVYGLTQHLFKMWKFCRPSMLTIKSLPQGLALIWIASS